MFVLVDIVVERDLAPMILIDFLNTLFIRSLQIKRLEIISSTLQQKVAEKLAASLEPCSELKNLTIRIEGVGYKHSIQMNDKHFQIENITDVLASFMTGLSAKVLGKVCCCLLI